MHAGPVLPRVPLSPLDSDSTFAKVANCPNGRKEAAAPRVQVPLPPDWSVKVRRVVAGASHLDLAHKLHFWALTCLTIACK